MFCLALKRMALVKIKMSTKKYKLIKRIAFPLTLKTASSRMLNITQSNLNNPGYRMFNKHDNKLIPQIFSIVNLNSMEPSEMGFKNDHYPY